MKSPPWQGAGATSRCQFASPLASPRAPVLRNRHEDAPHPLHLLHYYPLTQVTRGSFFCFKARSNLISPPRGPHG